MTTAASPAPAAAASSTISRPATIPVLVSIVAAIGAVVVLAVGDHGSGSEWLRGAIVLAWALLSVLVVWRASAAGVYGSIPMLIAASSVLAVVGHAAALDADSSTASGWDDPAEVIATFSVALLFGIVGQVLASHPDGRLLTSGRRWLVGFVYVLMAGVAVVGVSSPGARSWVFAAGGALVVGLGLALAHQRSLKAGPQARRRVHLMVVSVCGFVEVALVIGFTRVIGDWPAHPGLVLGVAALVAPLVVLIAPTRRMRSDDDWLTKAALTTVIVTAVVGGVYTIVLVGLGGTPEEQDRRVLAFSLVALVAAMLAVVPARRWAANVANRLTLGDTIAPVDTLRSFPARMTRAVPMDELLQQLVEACRQTFHLVSAEVWTSEGETGDGEMLEIAAAVPHVERPPLAITDAERPALSRSGVSGGAFVDLWLADLRDAKRKGGDLRVAPVLHAGRLLGLIVLELHAEAAPLRPADEELVAELARQVGLALHNVELDTALQETLGDLRHANEELQTSRARIVATADSERRKIERNLHDGAQQHLVALAVNLRLARDVVADDPAGAAEMLGMLADSVKETIEELRTLAHGIYPPLLVDSGLNEALRAAAGRSPLDVDVDCDGVGRYPSETEAAVYFCCLEALQNAAKHAPEASVEVTVREYDGRLTFTVVDDGPGFDPATAKAGHGYVNMSDRLGAIGGSVTWDSTPGHGATISGYIPLTRAN